MCNSVLSEFCLVYTVLIRQTNYLGCLVSAVSFRELTTVFVQIYMNFLNGLKIARGAKSKRKYGSKYLEYRHVLSKLLKSQIFYQFVSTSLFLAKTICVFLCVQRSFSFSMQIQTTVQMVFSISFYSSRLMSALYHKIEPNLNCYAFTLDSSNFFVPFHSTFLCKTVCKN